MPSIVDQLQASRRELLELSTRSRLLNTPRHRSRNKSVEIVDEKSDEIFRILVTKGRPMGFLADENAADESDEDAGELHIPLPLDEEEKLDENGVSKRHTDLFLQT